MKDGSGGGGGGSLAEGFWAGLGATVGAETCDAIDGTVGVPVVVKVDVGLPVITELGVTVGVATVTVLDSGLAGTATGGDIGRIWAVLVALVAGKPAAPATLFRSATFLPVSYTHLTLPTTSRV